MYLHKIWNVVDSPTQVWTKVPAKFEVLYIVTAAVFTHSYRVISSTGH